MKSQDRPKIVTNAHAAAHNQEDYVNFPISNKSEQINQPPTGNAAKFDVYSFLFRSAVVAIIFAFLYVVAIYYRVVNP